MERFIPLLGLVVLVGVAYLFSDHKKAINWKTVGVGIALQLLLGFLTLRTGWGQRFFVSVQDISASLFSFSKAGGEFVFGSLMDEGRFGFIFAFQIGVGVVFISALVGILYHLGIMQMIVKGLAVAMMKLLGTSGAESLSATANIFLDQTASCLIVRPFIEKMTRSELTAMMSGGLAGIAGSVLIAYAGMGIDAGHLVTACVISAPAALVCSKLMVPEVENPETLGRIEMTDEKKAVNVIDAAVLGTREGLLLVLNVIAILVTFIALVAMVNGILGWVGGFIGFPELSLELMMGHFFSPIAWLLGIPWEDCHKVGVLLGKKLVLNEFVAYLDLTKQMIHMNPRSVVIATYALCGFANFGSVAVIVGGIGILVPSRREDLAKLGMRALVAGTMACLMTACIVGLLL